MPRMSQDTLVHTAAIVSLAVTGGAAAEIGVQAINEAGTPTPEEHNAQVEACAEQLGQQAVRRVGLPGDCEPFQTGFDFHGQWVRVRVPTQTGLPAYDSWKRKVFDLPSADAFRGAQLEPVEEPGEGGNSFSNGTKRTIVAGLEAGLSAFGLLFTAGTGAIIFGGRRRKPASE